MTVTGKRLKALREARGLSQAEVASLIGVGRTTYLKYENGENKPVRKLKELSNLFSVSFDYLLDNNNPHETKKNSLANDESRLLNGYRELNADGKNLIMTMISQLNFGRAGQDTNDYLAVAT